MSARITVAGNIATTPIARVTRTGRKVTNFRVASTERYLDRESGQWVDGNQFFVSVACWGQLADNVELSLRSGMAVIVTGRISERRYLDAENNPQRAYEIQAENVGPDLGRATAVVTRTYATTGPAMGSAADGGAPVGVSEDPHQRAGDPAHPLDPAVQPGGGWGVVPADGTAEIAELEDPLDLGEPEDDREPAGLVGVGG